ncbi:MAG: tRNA (adenosine(37)-N6)-threonylcarbamoyltransferase complex transferase subunit TsaD [Bacteroidetes bacterium QS_9_68_14]|nr:MAG: tRNA (adenosine(37)-N6)-threonylcarbamoyltransferase complex transferase subunit TsaD [Bacteroidetes bacterium QS_9_68_14]
MPEATILGIETSCDDTCAAVMTGGRLRSSVTSTQTEHADFGGVVPEVASRAHQRLIAPVVEAALREAGVAADDLDTVAVTRGPGLSGALLVGLSYAKALAFGLGARLVGVDHLDGHLASIFLEEDSRENGRPAWPLLGLIASGGHTQLLLAPEAGAAPRLLGQTRDDAAGEAFDKTARLLDLPYPGGPEIGQRAAEGDPAFHRFPRSRPGGGGDAPSYDFSFSGLKTAVLYHLRDVGDETERAAYLDRHRADLCAAIQEAIAEVLVNVLFEAAEDTGSADLALVGGVAANRRLRAMARQRAKATGRRLFVPRPEYCTDNAAMICAAAHRRRHDPSPGGAERALTLDADPGLTLAAAGTQKQRPAPPAR